MKRKIRLGRVIIFIVVIIAIICSFYYLFNLKISNIYIKGNYYITDQKIIELSSLENYPNSIYNLSFQIENKLKKNIYINDVNVKKKWFKEVYIEIIENKPLFYYNHTKETILSNGTSTTDTFTVPTVINYVTDNYYDLFIKELSKLDMSILTRISEIKYDPNDVDDNRFLLSMNDGNYVYINITTFSKLNRYLSILENLPKEKGILYLDYGNNFEIIK